MKLRRKMSFMMAMIMIIAITAITVSGCHRKQYEEKFREESENNTQMVISPKPFEDETNASGEVVIPNDRGYQFLTHGIGGGTQGYYSDKTPEELLEIFKLQGQDVFSLGTITPNGKIFPRNNIDYDSIYFYDKVTGNISNWCSDPFCEGELSCIWWWCDNFTGEINYINDTHIYFISLYDDFQGRLYRCDLQRKNIEMLFEVATIQGGEEYVTEIPQVFYEKGDKIYFTEQDYMGPDEPARNSLKVYDVNTKTKTTISGTLNIRVQVILDDVIYYNLINDPDKVLYKTDLSFSNPQKMMELATIDQASSKYLLIALYDNKESITSTGSCIYNINTEEIYTLKDGGKIGYQLVGDYLYYTRNLTKDEIENSNLKDYYTYHWEIKPIVLPSGDIFGETKFVNAYVQGAGKIYRMKVDGSEDQCIAQLLYNGVPVKIESMIPDGETIYIRYNTYEEFKNFYNQDFDNGQKVDSHKALGSHWAVADLQSGTLTMIEFPKG